MLTIRCGGNTSSDEEPFAAVARFTSLTLLCQIPRTLPIVTASLDETFGRLELCELETLTHSS
jgi:hypothetical protein